MKNMYLLSFVDFLYFCLLDSYIIRIQLKWLDHSPQYAPPAVQCDMEQGTSSLLRNSCELVRSREQTDKPNSNFRPFMPQEPGFV